MDNYETDSAGPGSSIHTTEPSKNTTSSSKETHESPGNTSSRDTGNGDVEEQVESNNDSKAEPINSAPELVYPGTKERICVIIALMLAVFLKALDYTIISTAIPRITDEFHSLDNVGWYGSAYLLTSSCFQLLFGRVYTFYTPKYVFLILVGLFEVGSAICGAAPNSIVFIIGRAIAGVGSAGILSGGVILLVGLVPLRKRPIYQGFFSATFALGSILGPLLGGAFTTNVSWRWCFYINLPIGGIAIALILFLLKPSQPMQKGLTIRQKLGRLDLLGQLFLLPCIVCLLLALQWGGSSYEWSNSRIIALFTLFGVLLIGFIIVQVYRPETATLPTRILYNRSIIGSIWFTFCLGSVMILIVYYLPIWFQAIKGVSAVQSGINTIPLVLSLAVGSLTAGQGSTRVGYYTPFMLLSACLMPVGAGLITTFKIDTSEGIWIGYQILMGFSLGVGMQQGALVPQAVLKKEDVPTGVTLIFFCQSFGGAIFVSIGQNVLESSLIRRIVKVIPGLAPLEIVNTGATDLRSIVPLKDLHKVLVVYNSALREVFIVALAVACLAILGALFVKWRSIKGKKGPTDAAKAEKERKNLQ